MEQQQSSFKEKERIELREPRRFKVTIYNDDFTTMEPSPVRPAPIRLCISSM